jgi:hypothetical protein
MTKIKRIAANIGKVKNYFAGMDWFPFQPLCEPIPIYKVKSRRRMSIISIVDGKIKTIHLWSTDWTPDEVRLYQERHPEQEVV